MTPELLNAFIREDMDEVIGMMIKPQLQFVGDSIDYEVDLTQDAIKTKDLLVRTDSFINELCEIDDFSTFVNRIMLIDEKMDIGDPNITEILKIMEYDVEVLCEGYTYNNSDNCRLDRNIVYTIFDCDNETYVLISVHYGADARNGFGQRVCFKLRDFDYFLMGWEISASVLGENHEVIEDIDIFEIENVATYNEEKDAWIHDKTGIEVSLYSSANGF